MKSYISFLKFAESFSAQGAFQDKEDEKSSIFHLSCSKEPIGASKKFTFKDFLDGT